MKLIATTQNKILTAIQCELDKINTLSKLENDLVSSTVIKNLAEAFDIIDDYEDDEND